MSEIKWSEPMKPVAGEPRPAVYQFLYDDDNDGDWVGGNAGGELFVHGSYDVRRCTYRVPIQEPQTVPYLPYIVTKCEQRIRELRASEEGLAKSLEAEMQSAIRACADRLTLAARK